MHTLSRVAMDTYTKKNKGEANTTVDSRREKRNKDEEEMREDNKRTSKILNNKVRVVVLLSHLSSFSCSDMCI